MAAGHAVSAPHAASRAAHARVVNQQTPQQKALMEPSSQYLYLPNVSGSDKNAYGHHSFGDYVRAHDELRGWRRFLYPDQVIGK